MQRTTSQGKCILTHHWYEWDRMRREKAEPPCAKIMNAEEKFIPHVWAADVTGDPLGRDSKGSKAKYMTDTGAEGLLPSITEMTVSMHRVFLLLLLGRKTVNPSSNSFYQIWQLPPPPCPCSLQPSTGCLATLPHTTLSTILQGLRQRTDFPNPASLCHLCNTVVPLLYSDLDAWVMLQLSVTPSTFGLFSCGLHVFYKLQVFKAVGTRVCSNEERESSVFVFFKVVMPDAKPGIFVNHRFFHWAMSREILCPSIMHNTK